MAFRETRENRAELLDVERPLGTRSDDRHLPEQDVEKLWQFVEARSAEKAADARHARFAGARPDRAGVLLRIDVHRAEFEHRKLLAEAPDARLAIDDRSGAVELHGDGAGGQI